MKKNYIEYDPFDFLADSSFLKWMRHEDRENDDLWENWLKEHPDRSNVVKQAIEYYEQLVSFEKVIPYKKLAEDVWKDIELEIDKEEIKKNKSQVKLTKWLAAIFALIIIGGWFIYYKKDVKIEEPLVIKSGKDQKDILLSDRSQVFMNSFTTLKYYPSNDREIWLDGEAYFDVNPTLERAGYAMPFTVHAGVESLTVLGTSFSVKSRDSTARVVLVTGKVRASVNGQNIVMKPGEKSIWGNNGFLSEQVDTKLYLAWKSGQFNFNHTTLEEVKKLLKDIYGYDLLVKSKKKITTTISGKIDATDEEILLNTLGIMFNAKVNVDGKQVVFTVNN